MKTPTDSTGNTFLKVRISETYAGTGNARSTHLELKAEKRFGYITLKEIFKQLTNLDCNAVALSA